MTLFSRIVRWWRTRYGKPKPFVQGMTLKPGETAVIPFVDILAQSGLPAEEIAELMQAAEEGRLVIRQGPIRRFDQ